MGKYIIEIPEDMIVGREIPKLAIKTQLGNMKPFALDTGIMLMPYDDAEQRGAEKAWKLARWCFKDASDLDLERAFPFEWNHGGYERIADMPYLQAAKKYEAWQKQSEEDDEIKVGDEVRSKADPSKIRIVTNVTKVGDRIQFDCMKPDGVVGWFSSTKNFEKTGRYFPEVAELLKKMEGE